MICLVCLGLFVDVAGLFGYQFVGRFVDVCLFCWVSGSWVQEDVDLSVSDLIVLKGFRV